MKIWFLRFIADSLCSAWCATQDAEKRLGVGNTASEFFWRMSLRVELRLMRLIWPDEPVRIDWTALVIVTEGATP